MLVNKHDCHFFTTCQYYEILLAQENESDNACLKLTFPPISPICADDVLEEDTNIDTHDDHDYDSPNTSSFSDEGILVKEDTIVENHEALVCPSPHPLWEDTITQENEIINDEDDRFVLNNQILKVYNNPLYNPSPTPPILEQSNEVINDHDIPICSSPRVPPSCEEDTMLLENITNESHDNLSCPLSPTKKFIKQNNSFIDPPHTCDEAT